MGTWPDVAPSEFVILNHGYAIFNEFVYCCKDRRIGEYKNDLFLILRSGFDREKISKLLRPISSEKIKNTLLETKKSETAI